MDSRLTPRWLTSTRLKTACRLLYLNSNHREDCLVNNLPKPPHPHQSARHHTGHLSRAISRQVMKAVKPPGSTYSVQRRQAMEANALYKSAEAL